MHTSGAKRIHYDSGPNMTPLVDVVMVILIFLMLCGSFGGAEHFLTVNLPSRVCLPSPAKALTETIEVDIRVDHDPTNMNAWKARFGDVVTGSPATLADALHAKFQAFKADGRDNDHLQVVINPNHFVKWKSLVTVYEAAAKAGFTKIAFSSAH